MSFTTTIKEEISRIDNTKSESIAELSGFMRNNGSYSDTTIDLVSENATVVKRVYKLCKDLYDITCEIKTRKGNKKLKAILAECAQIAKKNQKTFFYAQYQRLAVKKGKK